jgi:hypothetical protein
MGYITETETYQEWLDRPMTLDRIANRMFLNLVTASRGELHDWFYDGYRLIEGLIDEQAW